MKNATIKTHLFRVRYKREDERQQLKILVKIGYLSDNKFNELKRYEVTIRDNFNNIYLVTAQQYQRLRAQPPTSDRLHLFDLETKVKKIVLELISAGKNFTVKEINNRLYSIQSEEAIDNKVDSME